MSIVFITHKLREVLAVCDRISVLRNGQNVLTLRREESSEEAFVRAMVGDEMNLQDSVIFSARGAIEEAGGRCGRGGGAVDWTNVTRLNEENRPLIKDISLEIHAGEILGIAGVAANGQRELCETILGVEPASSGKVLYEQREITHAATAELLAQRGGVHPGRLPARRIPAQGQCGPEPDSRVPPPETLQQPGFMDWKTILNTVRDLIKEYNIKTLGPTETGANLSGGNIQRVVVSRAFSRPCKLLVAHNPTRGLDIPSIDFVYSRLLERKKQGMATLLLSENLDELLLLCNRIVVIYRGEIVGMLEREKFEKYEIGRMMSGVRTN